MHCLKLYEEENVLYSMWFLEINIQEYILWNFPVLCKTVGEHAYWETGAEYLQARLGSLRRGTNARKHSF